MDKMAKANRDEKDISTQNSVELDPLAACRLIPSPEDFDMASYRISLGMSQPDFAKAHGISLATLRKWERNVSDPVFGNSFKNIFHKWLQREVSLSLQRSTEVVR